MSRVIPDEALSISLDKLNRKYQHMFGEPLRYTDVIKYIDRQLDERSQMTINGEDSIRKLCPMDFIALRGICQHRRQGQQTEAKAPEITRRRSKG